MSSFELKDNTVCADNQMVNSSEVYYLGNKDSKFRVLILGNSITRHGPKEDIGWPFDYGMAASCKENDYVHLLYNMLDNPYFLVRQAAYFERNFAEKNIFSKFTECLEFKPDLIIFRLGENVAQLGKEHYQAFVDKSLEMLNLFKKDDTKIIITTCFWKYQILDDLLIEMAKRIDASVVLLGDLGDKDEMRATGLFTHPGVAGHPGDKGMKAIASRIYEKI